MQLLKTLGQRLARARTGRHGLDYLISSVDSAKPLTQRLEWLVELLEWMRTPPKVADASRLNFASGRGQVVRMRHLLQTLEHNISYKRQIAKTLRSILRDIDALEVFRSTGLPGGHGLWAEATARFTAKLVPSFTDGKDLGEAFEVLFPAAGDAAWLAQLDEDILNGITALLRYDISPDEGAWNTIPRDMAEALFLLASEAQTLGLSPVLRRRRQHPHTSRFIPLEESTEGFLAGLPRPHSRRPTQMRMQLAPYLEGIEGCRGELDDLKLTLQKEGVSLSLVYTLARLEAILTRMQTVASLLAEDQPTHQAFLPFLTRLIEETRRQRSLRALWSENAALLSRRITERNADTGHHYITRNQHEYQHMVRKACGGGLITGVTVILKLAIGSLSINYLAKGLLTSLNYSFSFLTIQFAGFTLATKQPAMTAPAIASRITNLKDDRELALLVRELIHLVRSQVAAVFGNILGVIPTALAIHYAIVLIHGSPYLSSDAAIELLEDHALFGWSPFFAAFTGILLWLSSLIAGWMDNWVALNKIPKAIRGNRRLRFLLGGRSIGRLADFVEAHASTLGGNISLGFLLGLTPKVFAFAGIHLDVRHVTLAAGSIAFAAASLGPDVWRQHAFWQAFAGIGIFGLLNVGVSFGMAMSVAIKARGVERADKQRIYRALLSRIARRPLQVFLPVGLE